MKSKFLVLLLLLVVVFAGFNLAQAATSQIDNMPGGAGYAYWQTNSSWRTLLNIQNVDNGTMMAAITGCTGYWVDIILFDENSRHLADWQMPLTPSDNTGFVISGAVTSGSATGSITIQPYSVASTVVCGQAPTIGVPTNGLTISGVPVSADGFMKGYVSIVMKATFIAGVLTNEYPDLMLIRAAYLNGTSSAFAMNGPTFQGFVNVGTNNGANGVVRENNPDQWLDTVPRPNQRTVCDANTDGGFGSSYGKQSASRETIGFWEMMVTNSVFVPFLSTPGVSGWGRVVCDLNQVTYPTLGSSTGRYWARYNVADQIASSLVMVAPASSASLETTPTGPTQQIASPAYSRHLDANAYDDAENPISTILDFPEVARIRFGTNNGDILINATAGEARLIVSAPIFGFSYTELPGGFADAYPLVAESKNVHVTNLVYGSNPALYYANVVNAQANPLLQTVTDYGNFYNIPGTYWGPWVTPTGTIATGISQFGLGAEAATLSAISFTENTNPISPEIGSLSNHVSGTVGDLSGYKKPTGALCGFAMDTAGICKAANTAFDCNTSSASLGTVVCPNGAAGNTYYYNACYGVCYRR
ncbi:MAG: hypothetical protein HQL06_08605 [Nitrospirae bacterium]|nr:hypothetical protein [Nitrospirota bacterium]